MYSFTLHLVYGRHDEFAGMWLDGQVVYSITGEIV